MPLTNKPAIVIVPGAWHYPWHFRLLESALKGAGYEVTTCKLACTGGEKPEKDIWVDVAIIQHAIKSYADRGVNVALVMHSMGGFLGTASCQGMRPQDRQNGAGVIALVYICSFVANEGETFVSAAGGHSPWTRLHAEIGAGGWMSPDKPPFKPQDLFYNDCPPEVQEENVKHIGLCSEGCCHTPMPWAAWKHIESNYLICELDNAFPPHLQERMASQPGGMWKRVERIKASHSPFASQPEETALFIRKCAGESL